jgi:hypothetical protein
MVSSVKLANVHHVSPDLISDSRVTSDNPSLESGHHLLQPDSSRPAANEEGNHSI